MKLSGLISAPYLTLGQDAILSVDSIPRYQNYLKSNQINGAFINGSTSVFSALSTQERKDNLDAWVKSKESNFKLINHVGHTNLFEAIELTKHSIGKVDAIAALAPYYFKISSLEKLIDYCRKIAESAPDIPFYYYHIPVLTGTNVSMKSFIDRAANEIPNFAGIKFSEANFQDFQYCLEYNNRSFDILFGVDEKFSSTLPLGAKGWVGSTYNFIAPLYFEIQKQFDLGNVQQAHDLQKLSVQFVEYLEAQGGYLGISKGLLNQFGLQTGPSRFPFHTPEDKFYDKILEDLNQMGISQYFNQYE